MTDSEPLSMDEAARRFGVKAQTLRQAARRGKLRARKFADVWLVTAEDVGHWIAHGKHTPGPEPRPPRNPSR